MSRKSPEDRRTMDGKSPEDRRKTPEQALRALMWLCSKAEKSSGDALRLMRLWAVTEEDAQAVLALLVEQKFIDDARYAAAYVREKMRLNGWGPHKIRGMLATKGIAGDIADRALAQLCPNGDSLRVASRLPEMLARKLRTVKAGNRWELRDKLIRYGLSLGHDYDDVKREADEVIKDMKM